MTRKEHFLQLSLEEANSKLIAEAKKFMTLIEKSNDLITLTSAEGVLMYASPAIVNLLGYSLEEILKIPAAELIHPDDIEQRKETWRKIMNSPGKSFFYQKRLLHKNGGHIWCEGTVTNMLHEPGINAFVSNFRDITERKVAEKKLEQSEKRFREFFEIAPEGILIVDANTLVFKSCNLNALKLLKLSSEELLKRGPLDISPEFQPDGRRSEEKSMELILRACNGENLSFEWLIKDGENELRMFEVRLVSLSGGNNPELYASFVDITERKNIERTLRSQNKKLSEIAIFQSHQVRKPIASILGLVNLFNFNKPNDPLNSEIVSQIGNAAKMFDGIIREIVIRASLKE